MKVTFQYNKERDIWTLTHFGKGSNNDARPTQTWQLIVARYGENPTKEEMSAFIDSYLVEKSINIQTHVSAYQAEWDAIADEYIRRAEAIFGVSLPCDIAACLTINGSCPYNIEQNFFMVSMRSQYPQMTAMHELWHFYTWYSFGPEEEAKLGKQKYNDLKESLTVLLNVECKDLMPEGVIDYGYPQHQGIRARVLDLWRQNKDIKKLWNTIATE